VTQRSWCQNATFTLLLLLVLTAGCGGGDDDSPNNTSPATTSEGAGGGDDTGGNDSPAPTLEPGASGVDPCALLTQEEVEAALGEPAAPPERGATGPYETCTWNTQAVALKFVIVQVHAGVTREEFLDQKDNTAAFLDEDVTDVDDLGDSAYDLGGFLYAHQGDFEVVMTNILGLNNDDPDQAAQALEVNRTLMAQALARLP
jgi:hypothetical protein